KDRLTQVVKCPIVLGCYRSEVAGCTRGADDNNRTFWRLLSPAFADYVRSPRSPLQKGTVPLAGLECRWKTAGPREGQPLFHRAARALPSIPETLPCADVCWPALLVLSWCCLPT